MSPTHFSTHGSATHEPAARVKWRRIGFNRLIAEAVERVLGAGVTTTGSVAAGGSVAGTTTCGTTLGAIGTSVPWTRREYAIRSRAVALSLVRSPVETPGNLRSSSAYPPSACRPPSAESRGSDR